MDALIGIAIATVFLAPAIFLPTLGRVLMSFMLLGSASFNLLYTLPNTPGSLQALVANAAGYRDVIRVVAEWNATPALAIAVIAFELAAGLLILWHGPLARWALLAAGCGAWRRCRSFRPRVC